MMLRVAQPVESIHAYWFPSELDGHPQLAWMGDDWVSVVAPQLLDELRRESSPTVKRREESPNCPA
jgi:hypothetical protein